MTNDNIPAPDPNPDRDDSKPGVIGDDVRRLAETVAGLADDPEYLAQVLPAMLLSVISSSKHRLSKDEVRAFIESGGFTSEEWAEVSISVDRDSLQLGETADWLTGVFDTMSIEDAATYLDWEEDLVRVAVAAGQLYGVEVSGRLRLPTWQFKRGAPPALVDRLPELLRALDGRRPSNVVGFMRTEHLRLLKMGRSTPSQWLREGGDIDDVIRIIVMSDWD